MCQGLAPLCPLTESPGQALEAACPTYREVLRPQATGADWELAWDALLWAQGQLYRVEPTMGTQGCRLRESKSSVCSCDLSMVPSGGGLIRFRAGEASGCWLCVRASLGAFGNFSR